MDRTLRRVRFTGASLLCCLLAASCTAPGAGHPEIRVAPYYAVYQLRGATNLQSPGGGPTGNADVTMPEFGYNSHEGGWGLRADLGQHLTGVRAEFLDWGGFNADNGTLNSGWGNLLQGDTASLRAEFTEFRLGYHEELLTHTIPLQDRGDLVLRAAPGLVLCNRDLEFDAYELTYTRSQPQEFSDHGQVFLSLHTRAELQAFAFDLEYAISPDLNFGGDFDGIQQDLEARVSYTLDYGQVEVFAGYRYSTMEADTVQSGLTSTANVVLEGYQLGLRFTF